MKVMRTTVATVVAATLSMSAFSVFAEASLTGAGATFPAPVYAKWADTYQKETGNKVNYQGIGSSGGVKQLISMAPDITVVGEASNGEQGIELLIRAFCEPGKDAILYCPPTKKGRTLDRKSTL